MKTILVPTDFSANSENALDYAITLAQKEDAEIILLHAFYFTEVVPDIPADIIGSKIKNMEEESNNQLKILCHKVKNARVDCSYMSEYGTAVEMILETIDQYNIDLVIMGTKGKSKIERIILGSTTSRIIERAQCPVLAIPEKAFYKGIKKITYATDYHESDIEALKELVEIARPFDADIIILHALDENEDETEENSMKKFRNRIRQEIHYSRIEYHLAYGDQLVNVLDEHIKRESPDLLAMSTHKRSFLDKIFGSSTTQKMASHIDIPLIAFHYKDEAVVFI